MAESLNRKACDRCHGQKLSCKRTDDGPCERCIRLHATCKSSPSLRYKKQFQHQHQHPQLQHSDMQQSQEQQDQGQQLGLPHHQQQAPSQHFHAPATSILFNQHPGQPIQISDTEAAVTDGRSPKRRRTAGQVRFVQPDTVGLPILPPPNRVASEPLLPVGTGPALDLGNFGFHLNSVDYFGLPDQNEEPMPEQHLLPAPPPTSGDGCFPALHQYIDPWVAHDPNALHPQIHTQLLHSNPHILNAEQPTRQPIIPLEPLQSFVAPLDRRRRLGVSPYNRNRSRSTHITLDLNQLLNNFFSGGTSALVDFMSQLSEIDARLRALSAGLLAKERGHVSSASPNGSPNEFTVTELYRQTQCFVSYIDQAAVLRDTSPARGLESSDPGNNMSTLSTYVRLLDMFQRLFSLVRRQLKDADPEKDDTFPCWQLPEMNIGAASINTHPALHMSLTVQLAIQLLIRLRNGTASMSNSAITAATNGTSNGVSDDDASFADVVLVSFNATRSKEKKLNESLAELKGELDTFMDKMDVIDANKKEKK